MECGICQHEWCDLWLFHSQQQQQQQQLLFARNCVCMLHAHTIVSYIHKFNFWTYFLLTRLSISRSFSRSARCSNLNWLMWDNAFAFDHKLNQHRNDVCSTNGESTGGNRRNICLQQWTAATATPCRMDECNRRNTKWRSREFAVPMQFICLFARIMESES